MAIRSREIVFSLNVPVTNTIMEQHIYKLTGIETISFKFEKPIATEQGIAVNFIHPWFLKTFNIQLNGKTYIGERKNLKDTTFSINSNQNENNNPSNPRTSSEIIKPTYKYQEILKLMRDLNTISENIQSGQFAAFNTNSIVQTLEIKNYSDNNEDNLKFTGFISSLNISENSQFLGVLSYDIDFVGTLSLLSSIMDGAQKAQTSSKPLQSQKIPIEYGSLSA